MSYLASIIRLISPLLLFCIIFGLTKKERGFDFRFIRISIACVLWYFSWYCWRYTFSQYFEAIAHAFSDTYDSKFYLINGFITATYDTIALIFVVSSSYIISKWIRG